MIKFEEPKLFVSSGTLSCMRENDESEDGLGGREEACLLPIDNVPFLLPVAADQISRLQPAICIKGCLVRRVVLIISRNNRRATQTQLALNIILGNILSVIIDDFGLEPGDKPPYTAGVVGLGPGEAKSDASGLAEYQPACTIERIKAIQELTSVMPQACANLESGIRSCSRFCSDFSMGAAPQIPPLQPLSEYFLDKGLIMMAIAIGGTISMSVT